MVRRTAEQRIDMALGLVRQSHLEVRALRELLIANDKADPRLNVILDAGIHLSHAEILLEDFHDNVSQNGGAE